MLLRPVPAGAPASVAQQDFMIANSRMRVVYGFSSRAVQMEFGVYLTAPAGDPDTDKPAFDPWNSPVKIYFTKDGATIPFPGIIAAIKEVICEMSGQHVSISVWSDKIGQIELESWIHPTLPQVYIRIAAPGADALYFECPAPTLRIFNHHGQSVTDGTFPLGAQAAKLIISNDSQAHWLKKNAAANMHLALTGQQAQVAMKDQLLADRTNLLAGILDNIVREDGRIAAGAYRTYLGAWIRDGVMCAIGLMHAGRESAGRILEYLLRNVPPKDGQLEEYGMMVYGFYLYWLWSGDDELIHHNSQLLKSFVWAPFARENVDPATGLLASETEGYWERPWLGQACELGQNAWAVIAAQSYLEMAQVLDWDDDYVELRRQVDTLRERIISTTGFVREGIFVKSLWPGGEHRKLGKVIRGICQARFTPGYGEQAGGYDDRFAKPEDLAEVLLPLDPDAQCCVPWLWGMLDPQGSVARATGQDLWHLWNQDWDFGGLARYNVFADCDREVAGPYMLVSLMLARAYALQDDWEKVSLIIAWAQREFLASGWSEHVSRAHALDDPERLFHEVENWPTAEWLMLVYRDGAGLYPTANGLRIQPHLPKEFSGLQLKNINYRGSRYDITYHGWGSKVERIVSNDTAIDNDILLMKNGTVEVWLNNKEP
jgi:hypothetical protein